MARYIDVDKLWDDRPYFPIGQDAEYAAGFCDCYLEFSKLIRKHIDNTTADVVPKSEVDRLEKEIKALVAFKEYFSDLYGHGLEVANWHENGALEPFDNFYESAEEEYERSLT